MYRDVDGYFLDGCEEWGYFDRCGASHGFQIITEADAMRLQAANAKDALEDALDREEEILDYKFPETAPPNEDEDEPRQHPKEKEHRG